MKTRVRQISEKYRSHRLGREPFYHSRALQTVFNKFIKRGKKASSRRQIMKALMRFRMSNNGMLFYIAFIRLIRRLHVIMLLVRRRKGRQMLSVPVPVRRNQRESLAIQVFAKAVRNRAERAFATRFFEEANTILFNKQASSTLRTVSAHYSAVYAERVNMYMRWK